MIEISKPYGVDENPQPLAYYAERRMINGKEYDFMRHYDEDGNVFAVTADYATDEYFAHEWYSPEALAKMNL